MQIRTIIFHPDYKTVTNQTEGSQLHLQLFDSFKDLFGITVTLESHALGKARNLKGPLFTEYGIRATAPFGIPKSWLACTLTVLHYSNMVAIVCEDESPTTASKLYAQVKAAMGDRDTASLPAFYALPLPDGHKLSPFFGLKQPEAA